MENQKQNAEISLWRAVILQATLDCLTQSNRSENIKARKDAQNWFNIKNPNFIMVCNFAELDPFFVIRKVKYALKNQKEWRRACDIGKGLQFVETIA